MASFLYLALFLLFHIYFTLCTPICLHSAWSCVGFAGTLTEVSKSKIYVHKMCFHIFKTVLTNGLWQMGEKKRAFIFYSLPFLPARNDSKKCQLMVVHTVSTNTWRHVLPESNRRAQTVTWGEKAEVGRWNQLPRAGWCQLWLYPRHFCSHKLELDYDVCLRNSVLHAYCILFAAGLHYHRMPVL